jgi:hypothetical protein
MKGKYDNFKGPAIIAFIDLLGFSNSIKNDWNNDEKNPVKRLLEIRQQIETAANEGLSSLYIQENKELLIEGSVKVITLSDSFILLYGLQRTDGQIKYIDFINAFLSVKEGIKKVWQQAIKSGYTIRGSITVNEIYWDEKFNLIGPGLIEAYKLESEIAVTSRVIISQQLKHMLHKMFSDLGSSDFINSVSSNLLKDADGQIILHPKKLLSEITDLEKIVLDMAHKAQKGKIQIKYISLLANVDSKYVFSLDDLK